LRRVSTSAREGSSRTLVVREVHFADILAGARSGLHVGRVRGRAAAVTEEELIDEKAGQGLRDPSGVAGFVDGCPWRTGVRSWCCQRQSAALDVEVTNG
jgi:hypothetical protein